MSVIKKKLMYVGTGNIFSQLFFIWLFKFIWILRRSKDFNGINLRLRKTETSSFNDDVLGNKWKLEKDQAFKENR